MKKPFFFLVLLICLGLSCAPRTPTGDSFGLVVHGGAGTITGDRMTPELEQRYETQLTSALLTGYRILKDGGGSLDAVEQTIRVLEDSPLFNAGKGAVFTSAGTNELDASIMDGRTLNAGAVTGVKGIKNPISLARLVMDDSPHVFLSGEGAESFGRDQGLETVDQEYFFTRRRWESWQRTQKKTGSGGDTQGTVGVVALDRAGNLAAGTSTGGMINKWFGRIGDSPIIGAGTYANNATCAVSATGWGEYFIRGTVAHDISALMEYGGLSLQKAAERVIMGKLVDLGGSGGVIAIDRVGNVAMPFNTERMYRGYVRQDGRPVVKINND